MTKLLLQKMKAVHLFRIPYNLSHPIITLLFQSGTRIPHDLSAAHQGANSPLQIIPVRHLSSPTIQPLLIQRRETPQKVTWAFIASWVDIEILLMVIFCIPPLTGGQDLRNNLPLPPLLIRLLRHVPRNRLLLRIVIEDTRSVLRALIRALAV